MNCKNYEFWNIKYENYTKYGTIRLHWCLPMHTALCFCAYVQICNGVLSYIHVITLCVFASLLLHLAKFCTWLSLNILLYFILWNKILNFKINIYFFCVCIQLSNFGCLIILWIDNYKGYIISISNIYIS